MPKTTCSVEDCEKAAEKRGWCPMHYRRWWRNGSVADADQAWVWSKQGQPCVVCGVEVEPGNGRRKHCSANCQAIEHHHRKAGQQRPTEATCRLCGDVFSLGRRAGDGRLQRTDTMWCRDCGRGSPEALRFKRYGITPEQYDAALAEGCPICLRKVDTLHVDHDHNCCPPRKHRLCGKCTRGLLCGSCNRALGLLRDDPEAFTRARAYLLA